MNLTMTRAASVHTPPRELSTRLLGVWPIKDRATARYARDEAVTGLVELCVEHSVLPVADPIFSTFADRFQVLLAAHELGVGLVDLLALVEPIGFEPGWVFVAAVVDVKAFGA